jgi:hypothetical protein
MAIRARKARKIRDDVPPPGTDPEELAAWYDAHHDDDDLFWPNPDEPVRVALEPPKLTDSLTVRFTQRDAATLQALSQEKGIGPTTLVRMWVLERLQAEGRR